MRQEIVKLAGADKVTHPEIAERKRIERSQTALFQIAQLTTVNISEHEFYRQVHAVIDELITAEMFFVGLLSEDRRSMEFPYHVDATERNQPSRSLQRGLSEYVIRRGKALCGTTQDITALVRLGEIDVQTTDTALVSWLGVPILADGEVIGLIAMQSCDDAVVYGPADEELLTFVATQVAHVLHRRSDERSRRSRVQLELREKERTKELHARNAELEIAFAKLKQAQEQAIRSEKLASIGQLAAGVAHEINNPIGYVNSNLGTLQTYVSRLLGAMETYAAALARTGDPVAMAEVTEIRQRLDIDFLAIDLPHLITESREGIGRVCKIVSDLKDFARVDRPEAWEYADIHLGLESTLNIVANELKYKAQIIKTFASLPLIECLPSQLNQVFMNVLMNAGQAITERGIVTVSTGRTDDSVWIAIGDDGMGIPEDVLPRIFDPFFTTKSIGNGTGLGLSISHGIIAKHHGHIEMTSVPGQGTLVRIELPIQQQQR